MTFAPALHLKREQYAPLAIAFLLAPRSYKDNEVVIHR
jgi:hypothetical protein